jgi:hypothetical protein
VIDGELEWLTGPFQPGGGATVHELVERAGAPALLLERYAGRLEPHAPWHVDREVSHLFRGLVDVAEANELLHGTGHEAVRLVDNGVISPRETALDLPGTPHAYHLIPATASKAAAVARHMRVRGYAQEECVGVGDSHEDLEVAARVGRCFLVANALDQDPGLGSAAAAYGNVEITEAGYGEGFHEAVIRSLAERQAS